MLLKISFRNVFRQKRRTFYTAMSMFTGFVLGAFFIGWSDGVYETIIDGFTRSNMGHIQIHRKGYRDKPSLYKNMEINESFNKKIYSSKYVESLSYRTYASAMVSYKDKTAGVKFTGFDPVKEEKTTSFSKKIIKGKIFDKGASFQAVLGKRLADFLNVCVGNEVVVLTQGGDGSLANDNFLITGIADLGNEIDNRIFFYTSMDTAGEFLVLANKAHEVAIVIKDIEDADYAKADIASIIGDDSLITETWKEFSKDFYIAMEADRNGMYLLLFIIVVVVAMGVLNTVLMTILERKKEYGILKAIGTRPWMIVKMVVVECNIIALVSILLGTLVGLAINGYLSVNGLVLSEGFSYGGMEVRTMNTAINLRSFVIPALTIFFTATVVSVIPAIKASRTDAVKSMRAG